MNKKSRISSNGMVKEIMNVAGINKENATNILNLFTKAWNVDRIGFLKVVDTGLVPRKATARKTTRKAAKKATAKTTTKKASAKKTTRKTTAKKNTVAVAPTKTKKVKKNKKAISKSEGVSTPSTSVENA